MPTVMRKLGSARVRGRAKHGVHRRPAQRHPRRITTLALLGKVQAEATHKAGVTTTPAATSCCNDYGSDCGAGDSVTAQASGWGRMCGRMPVRSRSCRREGTERSLSVERGKHDPREDLVNEPRCLGVLLKARCIPYLFTCARFCVSLCLLLATPRCCRCERS